MKRKEAFNIPNIFESLAKDFHDGASWETIAPELYNAGHIPLNSASLAKMRIENYLKQNCLVWYRVYDPRSDRKSYLYVETDGKPHWTTSAEGAAFFASEKEAFRAIVKYGFSDFADVEQVKMNCNDRAEV